MSIINLPFAGLELGFAVSLACSLLLVMTTRWHGRYSLDATHGVQKFHITPTPRIGGAAIMLGLWLSLGVLPSAQQDLLLPVLVSAMPAFVFGLAEDLTRTVSVRARLLATMASGAVCWFLTGVTLQYTGLAPLDGLLGWLPFSVLLLLLQTPARSHGPTQMAIAKALYAAIRREPGSPAARGRGQRLCN